MDAKEARRLEVLEKNLVNKFRTAEREERQERANKLKELSKPDPVSRPAAVKSRQDNDDEPLTVKKARDLEVLQTKLLNQFADVHVKEMEEQRDREKKYEAITRAIKEKKEKDDQLEQKTKELMRKQKYNKLMRRVGEFKPSVSSTPERIGYMGGISHDDDADEPVFAVADRSIKELMDAKVVNLGVIGTRYLPRASDSQFGIYFDEASEQLKIGSDPISFDYDDIIVRGRRFKGTEGLWKLLTNKGFVKSTEYTASDFQSYKELLLATNSLFQKNDPTARRPKSSQGQKWRKLVKPIWDEIAKPTAAATATATATTDVEMTPVSGSGLKRYHDGKVEYRYINDLNELINRLNFIHAEEAAGNNSFHNEKLSVVKFIYDRMQELINRPNGLKYVVRCLSALPERAIEGSGLLNDIINKLPIELHAPRNWKFDSYNFCGPGTRLAERLGRGDKGVNPLDDACKQHDIWYRDHRKAEDRWVADEALQKAAWNRVTSADADLNERGVALATTGAMWLKRKLGLGLGTSACTTYPCAKKRYVCI